MIFAVFDVSLAVNMCINYSFFIHFFTFTLDISPLSARRDDLAMRFFHTLLDPASCLYHLIPNKRDNSQISKLRKPAVYEVPYARTNKFRNSFILYALNNYM